jgi:hypothetical protein
MGRRWACDERGIDVEDETGSKQKEKNACKDE